MVLVCACGDVASQIGDAPVGGEAAVSDAPAGDASADSTPTDSAPDAACTAEVLDGQDNDCDGQIDERFWATVVTVPYAVLAARDSGCSDPTAVTSNSYACQLAARRECQARGYPVGFRPVEASATEVAFTCITDVQLFPAVAFTELSKHIPDCSPDTAYRIQCFAAIKRYCQANGFKTGLGPFNVDTFASIDLACTNHAEYAELSFADIRTMFPACDVPTSASSSDFACFHAYHRYCRQAGWASAWGPVEQSATVVNIACLPAASD
jgi:hypothetical protein